MKKIQKMSEAEMEIMKIVWSLESPLNTMQVLENIPEEKGWKQSTVLTFLSRLTDKGLISSIRKGKLNIYSALVSEEEYRQIETANFIRSVHGGSVKSFIAALFDNDDISRDEIEELKKWFSEGR